MSLEDRLRGLLAEKESGRGLLIAFEGPAGAGKTSQRKLFKGWLRSEGHKAVTVKWGRSDLVKPLLKARKKIHALSPAEYCILHAVAFRHQLENKILPALWEGRHVIADGYLFDALARDSAAGLDFAWVANAYAPFLWPDVVFYFAVSPDTSGRRLWRKRPPKFYEAGQDATQIPDPFASFTEFVQRMNREYDALSLIFKFVKVDAEKPLFEQHRILRSLFQQAGRRPWAEWNFEAILDWARQNPRAAEAYVGK
jgi:dTMP kinase